MAYENIGADIDMHFRATLVAALLVFGSGRFAMAGTVGVRDIAVPTAEREVDLHALLWYPASNNGASVLIGANAVFRGTPGLQNGPIAEGRFPLVLISHGGFRAAPNVASWLASALAASGFIAAVISPPSIPHGPATQSVLSELWLRPADLSATLTAIENEPALAGKIDASEIGAVGFFLGGYAVLELAGARIDAAAYAKSCEGRASGLDCAWFAQGSVDLHHVDAARLERSNIDRRVRSAVVVDPELTDTLTIESLRAISVPVHIINLGREGTIHLALNASKLALQIPGAGYAAIPDAASFSSFAECKPKGPAILKSEGGEDLLCDDGSGRTRAEIHTELASAVEAALRQSFSVTR